MHALPSDSYLGSFISKCKQSPGNKIHICPILQQWWLNVWHIKHLWGMVLTKMPGELTTNEMPALDGKSHFVCITLMQYTIFSWLIVIDKGSIDHDHRHFRPQYLINEPRYFGTWGYSILEFWYQYWKKLQNHKHPIWSPLDFCILICIAALSQIIYGVSNYFMSAISRYPSLSGFPSVWKRPTKEISSAEKALVGYSHHALLIADEVMYQDQEW